MSMVIFLIPYLLFPLSVRAGPLSTVSSLPYLDGIIPPCAQSCFKSSIAQNFPTCDPQRGVYCLCTSNSESGLTLGEEALVCLASACAFDVSDAEVISAYEICLGVPNSKPMSHSTLTATQTSATTPTAVSHFNSSPLNSTSSASSTVSNKISDTSISSSTSTKSTITTTSSTTSVTSSSSSSSSSSASSVSVTPLMPQPTIFTSTSATTKSPASSTESSTSPASSSTAPASSPVLTKPQIAGVTVAGASAAAISFGLLFFIFCRRRRRRNSKRRNSGSSFGGDKIIESQQGSPRTSVIMASSPENGDRSRNLSVNPAPQTFAAPTANDGSRWTLWPRNVESEELGAAADSVTKSETSQDSPNTSTRSRRTNSQLLPDKPSYSLYPSPLRIKAQMSPVSPIAGNAGAGQSAIIPLARPSPRGRNSSDTSQVHLQHGRFHEQLSPSDPFVDPRSVPSPSTYARQQGQVSPSRLPYPNALNHGPWSRPVEIIRKPLPARQSLSVPRSRSTLNRSEPGLGIGMSTSPPRSQDLASSDLLPSSTAWSSRSLPRRKSNRRRPPTHFSMDSDTSFEDAGEDDEIPQHRHVLSPVSERSPPRQVRYPKIPTSVVPLTQHQPSLGSPTRPQRPRVQVELDPSRDKSLPRTPAPLGNPASLLAKRRGDHKASELAHELRNREIGEDELRQTAKWKILVSPGVEGIKDAGTPTTFGSPRTAKSTEGISPISRGRGR